MIFFVYEHFYSHFYWLHFYVNFILVFVSIAGNLWHVGRVFIKPTGWFSGRACQKYIRQNGRKQRWAINSRWIFEGMLTRWRAIENACTISVVRKLRQKMSHKLLSIFALVIVLFIRSFLLMDTRNMCVYVFLIWEQIVEQSICDINTLYGGGQSQNDSLILKMVRFDLFSLSLTLIDDQSGTKISEWLRRSQYFSQRYTLDRRHSDDCETFWLRQTPACLHITQVLSLCLVRFQNILFFSFLLRFGWDVGQLRW